MQDQLWMFSATEAHDHLKKRDISASELLESCIERILQVDSELNALPERCFDRARKVAMHLEKNPSGNPVNLKGLPIAVKDYNDLSGVKTTYGSPIFENNIPKQSDRTIRALEKNGANPVAKSNVPEWAGGHTFNPVYGLTRNPWDISKSAGGSSGGSASALASGQVFLATGNDLGGSLRTPAGFNGVVGLRPSPGLVPRGQRYMPFDTLWVEGPMARSVQDVALMLDAMAVYDRGDPLSFQYLGNSFSEFIKKDIARVSVSVSEDLGIVPVDKEVRSVFNSAIKKLENYSWDLNNDIPSFSDVLPAFKILRGVLLACMLGDLVKGNRGNVLEDIAKNVQVGFDSSSAEIISAEKIRHRLALNMENFFKRHDFLICPSASVSPFPVDQPFVKEIDGQKCETYIDWFSITFAITMTSCPSLSIPCGTTKAGLPVGIQITAAPRQEAALLNFGLKLQEIFGIDRKLPVSPAR
ncbi:MAG: amidase [Pseudomonadota bacterium]|nr:amidase [Pseudomonadota bacterium]